MSWSEREQREAVNLARHLNDSYADAVLLLAHAAGRPSAAAASVALITEGEMELDAAGDGRVRVPLPNPGDPLRQRVRAAVAAARAALPDAPLTALEQRTGHDGHRDGGTPHRQ